MPSDKIRKLFGESAAMIHRVISKIPIKISVPLLFTAPVLIVVLVLSVLFLSQGKAAVNDLIEQTVSQINDRINKSVDDKMKMALRVGQINADLIDEGRLDMSRIREFGTTFCNELEAFDMLSAIVWVGADGRSL